MPPARTDSSRGESPSHDEAAVLPTIRGRPRRSSATPPARALTEAVDEAKFRSEIFVVRDDLEVNAEHGAGERRGPLHRPITVNVSVAV